MTKQEKANRDIGLTFDFLRQVVENPKTLDKIPDGSQLEFVEKDFPKTERKGRKAKLEGKTFLRVNSALEPIQ